MQVSCAEPEAPLQKIALHVQMCDAYSLPGNANQSRYRPQKRIQETYFSTSVMFPGTEP